MSGFCLHIVVYIILGTRVGSLHNATRNPSSPVLGQRNFGRQSSKKNASAPLYVTEGNLPLPFGKADHS